MFNPMYNQMYNPMYTQGTMGQNPWMTGGPGFGFPPQPWGPWMGYGYGQGGFGGFPQQGGFGQGYYTESWPSDDQIRDMIFDSIDADPIVPFDTDVNVEVTGGVVTLTGTVPGKRIKHAIGDDAWWVPGVWDVNNSIQIMQRRKVRETGPTMATRMTRPATTATRPTATAKTTGAHKPTATTKPTMKKTPTTKAPMTKTPATKTPATASTTSTTK